MRFIDELDYRWTLAGIESKPAVADNIQRRIPAEFQNAFDAAILCCRYSPLLHSASIVARSFPEGSSAIDLVYASDERIDRSSPAGSKDSFSGPRFREGWQDRLAPFGVPLGWNVLAIAGTLLVALHRIGNLGFKHAEETRGLYALGHASYDVGLISAISQTHAILAASIELTGRVMDITGHLLFDGKTEANDVRRDAWNKLASKGLKEWLPCPNRMDANKWIAGIRAEQKQIEPTPSSTKPRWDSDLSQLTYSGDVIRKFRRPGSATNAIKVLDAFHEESWPQKIFDPLPAGKLHETLKSLNEGLTRIKFRADGRGEGIIWEET